MMPVIFSTRLPIILSMSALPAPPAPEPNPFGKVMVKTIVGMLLNFS
jgi:hypothetical protein